MVVNDWEKNQADLLNSVSSANLPRCECWDLSRCQRNSRIMNKVFQLPPDHLGIRAIN